MRLRSSHDFLRLTYRSVTSTNKTSMPSITNVLANDEQLDSTTPSQQKLQHDKNPRHPITHLVFGANTDVGKTVLTTALIRASDPKRTDGSSTGTVHYIKPLQSGGSDESFVQKHSSNYLSSSTTLFQWDTPSSPHFAARIENKPVSDKEVLEALSSCVREFEASSVQDFSAAENDDDDSTTIVQAGSNSIWIETAGGVLSPSSSSPENSDVYHAKSGVGGWGWITQADLYKGFVRDHHDNDRSTSVVLIGDGRLGGISSTLTALEALLYRDYSVGGILLINDGESDNDLCDVNLEALREYAATYPASQLRFRSSGDKTPPRSPLFDDPEKSILSLPSLPPEPEPLNDWFASSEVQDRMFSFVHEHLFHSYR